MSKMNPEIKAHWVAALRSGEYKQGRKSLRPSEDTFCCLGVLCNLHAQAHPEIAAEQTDPYSYLGESGLPSPAVFRWAGMDGWERVSIRNELERLNFHNDQGRTFTEIADAIEAQL